MLLLAFFSIGFAVWVANRWRQASIVQRYSALWLSALRPPLWKERLRLRGEVQPPGKRAGLAWEPFSPATVAAYRAQGGRSSSILPPPGVCPVR